MELLFSPTYVSIALPANEMETSDDEHREYVELLGSKGHGEARRGMRNAP
jgi:hypothetical protein